MCTVILLIRPDHPHPVMLAANRDERTDRAFLPPEAHWPDRPEVVGGQDVMAGGTWLAVNQHGLAAAVLNRAGSLGPAPGKRSRGELPLLALDTADAETAEAIIRDRDLGAYRSFNLVLADRAGARVLCADGDGEARTIRLDAGVHMVTAHDPDDEAGSSRIARHLPRFAAARPPDTDDWASWRALLADRSGPPGTELTVPERDHFGTVCATLLAIPAAPGAPVALWFAPGPPDLFAFARIARP
jgi:hypothetical protein